MSRAIGKEAIVAIPRAKCGKQWSRIGRNLKSQPPPSQSKGFFFESVRSPKASDCSTDLVVDCPSRVSEDEVFPIYTTDNTTHKFPESGNHEDEPDGEAVEDCEE
jgi:hypothetical protein